MAHRDVAVFWFWFVGRSGLIYLFAKKIKVFGNIRNSFLRYVVILPVLFVVRVALLVYWFYFMAYKDLVPHVKIVYHLNSTNWWKSKDEPFFTNCSIVNAFFCWFWWIMSWIAGLYFSIILFALLFYSIATLVFIIICDWKKVKTLWSNLFIMMGGGPHTSLYYYFKGTSKSQEEK